MHHEILARGVCVESNKILLARFKPKDYYFLPGGHVEFGESVLSALEREIEEEMGIKIKATEVRTVFEHTWSGKNGLVHEYSFITSFEFGEEKLINSRIDHLEFEWVSLDHFDKINFLPQEIKNTILEIANNSFVPAFQSSLRNQL